VRLKTSRSLAHVFFYPLSILFFITLLGISNCSAQGNTLKISAKSITGGFSLISSGIAADLVTDDKGTEVSRLAAEALQGDIRLLSGLSPRITVAKSKSGPQLIIGTLGYSKIIDRLAEKKLIPIKEVRGKWETFCLTVIADPSSPGKKMMVIFGSDPRGTAFGVFEFSKMLGVSPWVWWADVKPEPMKNIFIGSGKDIVGPPSVKYRGFFINDEDWGMRPWAANNMDKALKDIGPRTYEKVFELMLRLKANYLWPAMHPGTKAFWYYKENPELAAKYDIIMGSSHHEPMLRDTEFEWNENFKEEYGKDRGEWRYDTNKAEIYRFFDDRVKQSVNNPAIYTVGMRATKDGGMQGPAGVAGKISILEQVIHDQREILQNRLKKPAEEVPQVFCPYKEVLELYRAGLKVPEDVTITWVDDNHGYIRQLPNPEEQKRKGGSGVYYHFSYWGLPQDYLWLSSTSPVLTSFEMSKAYALNARKIWVFNVGDIKPAELELEFAMDLAWDIKSWTPEKAHGYVKYWAGKTFGQNFAEAIADIKSGYYRLAAAGKPEHLTAADFSAEEITARLAEYADLVKKSKKIEALVPERLKDAYFQLIGYPVEAASCMNEKVFYAKGSLRLAEMGKTEALEYAQRAKDAYARIGELTQCYNNGIAGGKWNAMMDDHPRGAGVFNKPTVATPELVKSGNDAGVPNKKYLSVIAAEKYKLKGNDGGRLKAIGGLGSSGTSLTMWPLTEKTYSQQDISKAPYAEYAVKLEKGENRIAVRCLPTFPLYQGMKLRYAISINGSSPEFIDIASLAETKVWSSNVLRGYSVGETIYKVPGKQEVLVRIYFADPGLVLSEITSRNITD
jgi:hypothetical protein